jgi:predicted TIM-barrel fold metal-dependent hydrolase
VDDFPKIVSVDDHIVEAPTMWIDRLPKRYHDTGPRVVRSYFQPPADGAAPTPQGSVLAPSDQGLPCDWWFYEDLRVPLLRTAAAAGFMDENGGRPITYDDLLPGCTDPTARLLDMDANHVEASLCFPNLLPRFCGQTFLWAKDRNLAQRCVNAYNDWMIETWCAPSRGRLIPLCLVPLWDAHLAADEVRRNAARGARAVTFSESPSELGLPSIHHHGHYWDPFFRACEETATVICIHIGSSSKLPYTAPDAPLAVAGALLTINSMKSMVDWLFSGVFDRFPGLKLAYSEGNIGWIPYILERVDNTWTNHRWSLEDRQTARPPSEYYQEHIFGCFIHDPHGAANIERIGVDNVTLEVDYPHADTTWPNSVEVVRAELAHLTAEQRYKVVRGNAIQLFGLTHLESVPTRV